MLLAKLFSHIVAKLTVIETKMWNAGLLILHTPFEERYINTRLELTHIGKRARFACCGKVYAMSQPTRFSERSVRSPRGLLNHGSGS